MSWWAAVLATWFLGFLPLGVIIGRMINTGRSHAPAWHLAMPALHTRSAPPANACGAITDPNGSVLGSAITERSDATGDRGVTSR